MSKWISLDGSKDSFPKYGSEVLIYYENGKFDIALYTWTSGSW